MILTDVIDVNVSECIERMTLRKIYLKCNDIEHIHNRLEAYYGLFQTLENYKH